MKILVVDDRPENCVLLQKQLQPYGHAVVTAENGARALAHARTDRFDLVVSDLLMPVMDGYQLCYSIKADPLLNRMPVVLYTATYVTRKDEKLAESLGADDLVAKPIEPDEFIERINKVVARQAKGGVSSQLAPHLDEKRFLREYNGHLIQSLEDRLLLAESNQSLQSLNRELEKQVAAATRKLQASHDELASANNQLRETNRELERFTYTVSHDLRAPARAIQGLIAVVREELDLAPDSELARVLERIDRNAEHMDQLINDLLRYSRMAISIPAVVPVSLERLVQQSLDRLQEVIRAKAAKVTVESPLPAALADEVALSRVIENLLDNALKFVPS
jgi:CheY-like chemotaxis protein